eukprot:CAMPEP_0194741920 /NCGR_PEP_ID=MMETSP0296-20130528/97975_1 /TAXON_ID=39354 /ORGANISM="Heterosigma akashiwo, Strain CCMP2393" /LENGTH=67 /DNA_ID=CAMNT_0039653651 /DNA_START=61 /DNA_END=260 /DNA_ORIENTATION=+
MEDCENEILPDQEITESDLEAIEAGLKIDLSSADSQQEEAAAAAGRKLRAALARDRGVAVGALLRRG